MPWVRDRKAEGGFKHIRNIVCRKCSYVITEDNAIFEGGRYQCPKCGYKGGPTRTVDPHIEYTKENMNLIRKRRKAEESFSKEYLR